jgi:imidazolonepropionase-like amidohydrolase
MATFEEMELLARIGVPPADIIRAATLNPARSLRRDADLGSIQTGKVGDLVLFRGNPLENMAHIRSPWLVVRRGEVILKRD